MDARRYLESLVRRDYPLHMAAPGIYSVLPVAHHGHRYDTRAVGYDAIIGSERYNRFVWGTSREQYAHFAQQAVRADADRPLLDAGCGSMIFTAAVYAGSRRPIIALDQSLGMLQQAQQRIVQRAGTEHRVIFLQADLFDLPFDAGSVQTVLCMGMLHLFANIQPVLEGLQTCCQPNGMLFLTSLVQTQRLADRYLDLLAQTGEIAPPRMPTMLRSLIAQTLGHLLSFELHGNMASLVAQAPATPVTNTA